MNPKQETPSSNVVFTQSYITSSKREMLLRVEMSDMLLQQFGNLSEDLLRRDVLSMELREKQPDEPLSGMKSFFAKVFSIKALHEFMLFQTEDFLVTVDFYQENIIAIRLGDHKTVLNGINRANSKIVKENAELDWKFPFKKGSLNLEALLSLLKRVRVDDYSQLSNRGQHFSRNLWREVKSMAK